MLSSVIRLHQSLNYDLKQNSSENCGLHKCDEKLENIIWVQPVAGVCLESADSWKSILRDISLHLFPWGVRSDLLLLIPLWERVFNTASKECGSPGLLNQGLDAVSLRENARGNHCCHACLGGSKVRVALFWWDLPRLDGTGTWEVYTMWKGFRLCCGLCLHWIMGMFVQFGLWPFLDRLGTVKLEKTVEKIHKMTFLNKSFKGSTEDLPPLLFGIGFPWRRPSWCHWGGGNVCCVGLTCSSNAMSEPEGEHVHVSVRMACAGTVLWSPELQSSQITSCCCLQCLVPGTSIPERCKQN